MDFLVSISALIWTQVIVIQGTLWRDSVKKIPTREIKSSKEIVTSSTVLSLLLGKISSTTEPHILARNASCTQLEYRIHYLSGKRCQSHRPMLNFLHITEYNSEHRISASQYNHLCASDGKIGQEGLIRPENSHHVL